MFLTSALELVSPWRALGLRRLPSSCVCSLSSIALPVPTLQTESSGGIWFHHLPVVGLGVSSIRQRCISYLHHRLIWKWNDFWYVGNLNLCSAQSQLQTHLFSFITLIIIVIIFSAPWEAVSPDMTLIQSLKLWREPYAFPINFLNHKHWKLFSLFLFFLLRLHFFFHLFLLVGG